MGVFCCVGWGGFGAELKKKTCFQFYIFCWPYIIVHILVVKCKTLHLHNFFVSAFTEVCLCVHSHMAYGGGWGLSGGRVIMKYECL